MKKTVLVFAVLSLLLLAACVKNPGSLRGDVEEQPSQEELDLLQEIEEIERQLEADGSDLEESTEESSESEELGEEAPVEETEDTSGLQQLLVSETELAKLNINVNDADNDELQVSYSSPLSDGGEWQTDYGDAGEYVVTVTVSDGLKETKKKILLIVEKNNVAPQLSGLTDLSVPEGELVVLDPEVSDLNGDDVILVFSAPLDAQGGWQTDFASAGVYEITVSAADGEETTEQTLTLSVTDVNQPPLLSGFFRTMNVEEGDLVTLQPTVDDPDGDEVTITISEPVGDDGEWQTGFTDNGEYIVNVTAFDGKDTVSEEITLIVNDVNQAPEILDITLG